jgi:hypothetical protein
VEIESIVKQAGTSLVGSADVIGSVAALLTSTLSLAPPAATTTASLVSIAYVAATAATLLLAFHAVTGVVVESLSGPDV